MNKQEEINNFRMALAAANLPVDIRTAELIHEVKVLLDEKGDEADMRSLAKIRADMEAKWAKEDKSLIPGDVEVQGYIDELEWNKGTTEDIKKSVGANIKTFYAWVLGEKK